MEKKLIYLSVVVVSYFKLSITQLGKDLAGCNTNRRESEEFEFRSNTFSLDWNRIINTPCPTHAGMENGR